MQAPWDILGWERGRRDPAPTGITSTASGQAAALHTPPVLTEAKERSQRQGQQQRASATATSHGAFVASCNSTEKQVLEASAPHFQRQRAVFWVGFVVQILEEKYYFINCSANSKRAAGEPRSVSITAARTSIQGAVCVPRRGRCSRQHQCLAKQ